MKWKLSKILKFFAVLAYFWAFFPSLAVVNLFVAYDYPFSQAAWQLLAMTLSGFLGYGIRMLSLRLCPPGTRGWRLFVYNVLRYGGAAGLFAAAMILFPQPAAFAVAIFMLITFFAGQVQFSKPYYNILKAPIIMVHICGGVILALCVWGIRKNRPDLVCPLDLFILIFLIFICICAVIRSQGTLDYLMDRREHDISAFPRSLRIYNFALICVLLVVMVIPFLFRKPIGEMLSPLVDGMLFGLKAAAGFIVWIRYPLELKRKSGSFPKWEDIPEYKLPGSRTDVINFTLLILILFAILFIVYRWNYIISGLRRFWNWMKKFFSGGKIEKKIEKNIEYVDAEENLTEDTYAHIDSAVGWKVWRKNYQAFLEMEESDEKLRFGFRLMVEWLSRKGANIQPSDTPIEIMEKSAAVLKNPDHTAAEYNKVRYGEKRAEKSPMRRLTETLRHMYTEAHWSRAEKKARRRDGKEGK